MARRATFIDSTKLAYSNVLLTETGNVFETQQDYQLERGMFLLHAMKSMGYHVIGVGEKDLAYGVKLLQDSCASIGLVPVSANVADPVTGKLLFKPWSIESVHGVKVGVFSLLSADNGIIPAASNMHPDSLKFLNPEEAAKKAIAELRPQCQVVVGLFNLGNQAASALAGKLSGLDVVIVGSQVPRMAPKGEMSGTSYVVSSGIRGQYIGRTLVELEGGKPIKIDADVLPLDDKWVEQERVANLRKDFEDGLNDRLAKRQREVEMAESKKRGSDHYTGLEACVKCHKPQHDVWLKTAHAAAFNTLVEKKKSAMPDCVPCHVTGYRESGGYYSINNPGIEIDNQKRHLENVQCEACHGPGTRHDTGDPKFVHTPHSVCQKCHTPEQDPTFKFDVSWAKIAH